MTGSKSITAALVSIAASSGVLLSSTTALAGAMPAEQIAQTTVPTQRPDQPGQARFQDDIEAYGFEAFGSEAAIETASEANVSAAPACISGCRPWLMLNRRF